MVALQKKHAKAGQRIENDLQTNGTLLDENWARFLHEHRFLVGLSIDGPREIHDRYRITKRGAPTFDTVYAAAKMLQRFRVPFNTLTCVHRFNAARPLDVHRFLRRELGSTFLQFIPIVEIEGFETTAPQTWDAARLPVVGSPEARPGHPDSVERGQRGKRASHGPRAARETPTLQVPKRVLTARKQGRRQLRSWPWPSAHRAASSCSAAAAAGSAGA